MAGRVPPSLSAAPDAPECGARVACCLGMLHHDIVCRAIARHLSIDPVAIELTHRLEQDWGLNSLDLVLILARLEETAHIDLPLDLLRSIDTVGQLSRVVDACVRASAFQRARRDTPSSPYVREELRRVHRRARSVRTRRVQRRASPEP